MFNIKDKSKIKTLLMPGLVPGLVSAISHFLSPPLKQVDLRPPPSDLALGGFVRRVLVNGHLVEFVHLVGGVERGFELRARGTGAH